MKYKELINFEPIDEIIKFGRLDQDNYKASVVKNFVCSESYEGYLQLIAKQLDFVNGDPSQETKGIQVVGNYGTGKSHLMSLFSIIAENDKYLPLLQNEKARKCLEPIAGKFKVKMFELGHKESLWDVICYNVDNALDDWGVDYSMADSDPRMSYAERIKEMLKAFEQHFPNMGFLLVVDEMLSFLRGRCQTDKLNSDLQVLQALGQESDRSRFTMVFGVQEAIYRVPEFQSQKDMLLHANDRYVQFTIEKEDVKYIVKKRLLQKTDDQLDLINEHLSKFTKLFPEMNANLDDYTSLFPVHPEYFDNFQAIKSNSQREILRTLSDKFKTMLDEEVPEEQPGLVSYDSYWEYIKGNVSLTSDPNIRRVKEITDIIDQKIDQNFTRGLRMQRPLAHRIVSALAIKILQDNLASQNGNTMEKVAEDLCYVNPIAESFEDIVNLSFYNAAEGIREATLGSYFDKKTNGEYHIRIEGGPNYEQMVDNQVKNASDSTKDNWLFAFMAKILPVTDDRYVPGFDIYAHAVEWKSHKCMRDGYIFMGNPGRKSTTQPLQHFYIYFMPVYEQEAKKYKPEPDGVFFFLDDFSDEIKNYILLSGAANELANSVDTTQRAQLIQLSKKYFDEARRLFDKEFVEKTKVEYMSERNPLLACPGANVNDSNISRVNAIVSNIMESAFERENPAYPKFNMLSQPLTSQNRDILLKAARTVIAKGDSNRNGEAILEGLGLWKGGQLSTTDSQYARSIQNLLKARNGGVVNNVDILYRFYENIFISCDYKIESDLEFIVLATMAQRGELEIVMSSEKRINAVNINDIININPVDTYSFKSVCPPKGINLPVVKVLYQALTGEQMNDIDNPSVCPNMVSSAKVYADNTARMLHNIQYGYEYHGIPIITSADASSLKILLSGFQGACQQVMNSYTSKARLRNIPWSVEDVESHFVKPMAKLKELQILMDDIEDFRDVVDYLQTARGYVDVQFSRDIEDLLNELPQTIHKDTGARSDLLRRMEEMRSKYAKYYFEAYQKEHITDSEAQMKVQVENSDNKKVCEQLLVCNALVHSRYNDWKRNMQLLKPANPRVTLSEVKAHPFLDGFNPMAVTGGTRPSMRQLKQELDEINSLYKEQIDAILEDPSINDNRDMLNASDKKTLDDYQKGNISLNPLSARQIAEIINRLHQNIERIEITHTDLQRILSRPMTKSQLLREIETFINDKSRGFNQDEVRFFFK